MRFSFIHQESNIKIIWIFPKKLHSFLLVNVISIKILLFNRIFHGSIIFKYLLFFINNFTIIKNDSSGQADKWKNKSYRKFYSNFKVLHWIGIQKYLLNCELLSERKLNRSLHFSSICTICTDFRILFLSKQI